MRTLRSKWRPVWGEKILQQLVVYLFTLVLSPLCRYFGSKLNTACRWEYNFVLRYSFVQAVKTVGVQMQLNWIVAVFSGSQNEPAAFFRNSPGKIPASFSNRRGWIRLCQTTCPDSLPPHSRQPAIQWGLIANHLLQCESFQHLPAYASSTATCTVKMSCLFHNALGLVCLHAGGNRPSLHDQSEN